METFSFRAGHVLILCLLTITMLTGSGANAQSANCETRHAFGSRGTEIIWLDLLCKPVLQETVTLPPRSAITVNVNLNSYMMATGSSNVEFNLHFALDNARLEVSGTEIDSNNGNLQNILLSSTYQSKRVTIRNVESYEAIFDLSVRPVPPIAGSISTANNISQTPEQATTTLYIAGNNSVNIRSCPGTDCEVRTTMEPGSSILVLETITGQSVLGSNQWHKFAFQRLDAYVHSSLVTEANPVAQISPIESVSVPSEIELGACDEDAYRIVFLGALKSKSWIAEVLVANGRPEGGLCAVIVGYWIDNDDFSRWTEILRSVAQSVKQHNLDVDIIAVTGEERATGYKDIFIVKIRDVLAWHDGRIDLSELVLRMEVDEL